MLNKNIAIISNIVLEPYFIPLMKNAFEYQSDIVIIPYVEYNEEKNKVQLANADLIVVWLNFENLYPDVFEHISVSKISNQQVTEDAVCLFEMLFRNITEYSNAYILTLTFEDYYRLFYTVAGNRYNGLIDQINQKLVEQFSNKTTFLDFKHLIAQVGISNAYDLKGKYRWNSLYSRKMIEGTCIEICKQYAIYTGKTKKCLILDCDNVLWGGIISEDGVEGIRLGNSGSGKVYKDFQRFVLELYHHGVILALCSKNDLEDVLIVFREHSEMVLKEHNISCSQVNWIEKARNIRRISELLNIGLESMVFVDDSPVEIAEINILLPEVTTIQFHRDMDYSQFSCFNLKSEVNMLDIERRNTTYRTNICREELKMQYSNNAEYIKAMAIKTDIHKAVPVEYNRILELTQRTNKCTNGKRFTLAELKEYFKDDEFALYSVHVSDRFSELGLVGTFAVKANVLIMFSLSCRALGRGVEKIMIEYIINSYEIRRVQFHVTGKNDDLKNMLIETFHIQVESTEV